MPAADAMSRAGGGKALLAEQARGGAQQLLPAVAVVAFAGGLAGATAGSARFSGQHGDGQGGIHGRHLSSPIYF
jgi:hypothetical protein